MSDGKLFDALMETRKVTEDLARPLRIEDYVVQPEECVSPPKWHLAHTTWFFEAFILERFWPGYRPYDPAFNFLFNSYYEAKGPRAAKARRGTYSRPTVEEVFRYRNRVDTCLREFFSSPQGATAEVRGLLELGLHHEQQHQELLLTDIKNIFHANPSRPAYASKPAEKIRRSDNPRRWIAVPGGLRNIGWSGEGFAFDNEKPRHRIFLRDFRIEDRPVTNSRYLDFMRDGGYARPELWLSDGWQCLSREGWRAPLYWEESDGLRPGYKPTEQAAPAGAWTEFTLHGQVALDPDAPVCHVSYYEADAFARWSHARLPTEGEWETALSGEGEAGGEVWEWTASAYLPYPGFSPLPGSVGEYNGKFMVDQMVLRGGSCVTPRGHIRASYRNFFPAGTRWQFSGIRLAEDI